VLFSIITINLNNSKGLLNTLNSIHLQKFTNFEHIIIDGFSSDESLIILNSIKNDNCTWISEKDYGIYDAMNKGISKSKGDYILFLNSGDSFYDENSLSTLIFNLFDFDIIYGDIIDNSYNNYKKISFPKIITLEYMLCAGLPHQATAFKRSLFYKYGFYETNYKIISDWAFFMSILFIHKISYKYLNVPIACFEGEGVSSKKSNLKLIINEHLDFLNEKFPTYVKYFKRNSIQVQRYINSFPRWKRLFYFIKFYFY
jgi:glycosyltransferase involved in cell wall biosynthesis